VPRVRERAFAPLRDRSIGDPVLAGRFHRHLHAELDLSSVRDRAADKYAERGRIGTAMK